MDSGENYQDENERDDNFHPTIRIMGEERTVHENLGVQRVKLRVQLLDPPEPLNMNVSRYNEILNSWLNRTFTALLESAKSKLNINPRDKVGLVFRKSDNDTFSLSFRRFDQYNAALITSAISRILPYDMPLMKMVVFHEKISQKCFPTLMKEREEDTFVGMIGSR